MPTTIKLKNSVTTTNAPSSLAQGEVAINVTDKKVWVGNAATTPVLLLGSGADGTFTNLTVSGVASFADGTVSLPSITNIGDTNTGIFFPAADTIAFTEGGVESMRIDSAGNLGIGTTSPSEKLELFSSGTVYGKVRTSSGGAGIIFQRDTSATTQWLIGHGAASANGNFEIYTAGSGDVSVQTNGSERMRIVGSTGNVGIGTSSPQSLLELKSTTGTVTARLNSASGSGREYGLASSSTGGFGIYDFTGSSYVTFINSSGNVSLKNATTSANGIGITFPATQSASSDANTLDDYEEGTFTPTAVGTTTAGTGTYSTQVGAYTKIGNQVTFDIVIAWSAHTGTGNLQISGLPFTQRTTNGERYSYSIVAELLTYTGTLTTLNAGGNTTISLFSQNSASGLASVAMDGNVSYMVITGTYFV
jgi:hypothetical protein